MTTLLLQSLLSAPLIASVMTATDASDGPHQRFSVLGVQICVGEPEGGPCHVRLPTPSPEQVAPNAEGAEPKPGQLTLFGKTLCIGDVPDATKCDVHLKGTLATESLGA